MKRFILVCSLLLAVFLAASWATGANLNSRFTDSANTFKSLVVTTLRATTGTITTLTSTTGTITTLGSTTANITTLNLNGKTVVATKVTRDNHTGGAGDSIAVAGLDIDDICVVTISRKTAAADSSISILSTVQGVPTVGKLYIKTSAVPTDSLTYSVIALED